MSDTAWIDNARVNDVATWPTKEDLRNQLRVTDRTIERWVQKDKLHLVQRRNLGEKSRPCYNPDDVRLLMKDVVEVVPIVPTQPTTPTTSTVIPDHSDTSDRRDLTTQVNELTEILTLTDMKKIVESLMSLSRMSPTQKTYLSLQEAAEVSGLTESQLKELVAAGKLQAVKGKGKNGRWKFCRADIEAGTIDTLACLSGMTLQSPSSKADTTRPTVTATRATESKQGEVINGHH